MDESSVAVDTGGHVDQICLRRPLPLPLFSVASTISRPSARVGVGDAFTSSEGSACGARGFSPGVPFVLERPAERRVKRSLKMRGGEWAGKMKRKEEAFEKVKKVVTERRFTGSDTGGGPGSIELPYCPSLPSLCCPPLFTVVFCLASASSSSSFRRVSFFTGFFR